MREIGEAGEVAAVPYLLPFVLERAFEVRAAATIHQLMETATEEEVARLHEGRSHLHTSDPIDTDARLRQNWGNLRPEQVSDFDRFGPASVWVLGLTSFHWVGHVRQAAVEGLARLDELRAVPFLLLRANDWVRQVRQPAQRRLESLLDAGRAEYFAHSLGYLRRLARGGRGDHGPFIEKVRAVLVSEPDLAALRQAAATGARVVRREAFDLAWQREDSAITALLASALEDADVVIRHRAAQRALRADDPARFLESLRTDPASAVRKEYVDFVGEDPGRDVQLLVPFLVDGHGGIRADTHFYLTKRGWSGDFVEFYRGGLEAAQKGAAQKGAAASYLSGLGEVGSAIHLPVIRPYLDAELPRVRRAAVRALGRLATHGQAGEVREDLLAALEDPFASVAKAARDVIVDNRLHVPASRLIGLACGAAHRHGLRMATQLLVRASGKWTAIESLAELAVGEEGEDLEVILHQVDWWLRKAQGSFVKPTPGGAASLRRTLEGADAKLGWRRGAILDRLEQAGG